MIIIVWCQFRDREDLHIQIFTKIFLSKNSDGTNDITTFCGAYCRLAEFQNFFVRICQKWSFCLKYMCGTFEGTDWEMGTACQDPSYPDCQNSPNRESHFGPLTGSLVGGWMKHLNHATLILSVTRRYRSDVFPLLLFWVSTDLNDVTLVSEDTY